MRIKKGITMALAALIALCSVGTAGCGKQDITTPVDGGKTQLYVSSYDKGFGIEWLEAVAKRFEAEYANFENGDKKGVEVVISSTENNGVDLLSSNPLSEKTHVYFNEVIDYNAYVTQGIALDLTDYVKQALPGESTSVLDKFTDDQVAGLSKNGHYYMIPHYAGFNGITIDEDFINSKSLFIGEDGQFNKKSTDSGLSAGPDGKKGTYDDGLPATFEEFYNWMKRISLSAVPMVWSGKYQFYATRMLEALAADVNGAEATKIGYSFSGTLDNLVASVGEDGTVVTESSTITPATGYEVLRQDGYYYSLKFMENIIDNNYYHSTYCFDSGTHRETQMRFLRSNTTQSKEKAIAMMVEGSWWECEASDDFDSLSKYGDYSKTDRNFRFIPFPKATADKVGEGTTLLETNRAYGFVNANLASDKTMADLAAKFLLYCNTDVSLREFTKITSTVKALNYTMDDTTGCTTYCKSLLNLKNAEATTVVYPVSDSEIFRVDVNAHTLGARYKTSYGTDPAYVFKYNAKADAKGYFDAMQQTSANWNVLYGAYFD